MSRPSASWVPLASGCAVTSAVLGMASLVNILFGAVFSLLSPMPVMLAYARLGAKKGRLTAAGSLLLAFLATGFEPVGILFFAAMCLPLAVTASELLQAGHTMARAIAGGTLVGILVMTGTMTIGTGGDLQAMEQVWQTQWSQVENAMEHMAAQDTDLSLEDKAQLSDQVRRFGKILFRTTPGIIFGFSLLITWANILLTRQIAAKLCGHPLRRFDNWQTPFHMVWLLVAALAIAAFFDGWAFWLGVNAIIVLCMIYFLQGMAVLTHFVIKYKAPLLLRVCIYSLVFITLQTSLIFLAAAGLFDTCFNLRRFAPSRPD